jgi:DNA-binding SARP family transcriptional activator
LFWKACQAAKQETNAQRRIDLLRTAISLYQHPYGPEIGGVWAEPIRRQYALAYEEALLELAETLLDQGKLKESIEHCQFLLDIEPCQEKAYQICMRAYSYMSDRTNLIRIYNEYVDKLDEEIGISPSDSTRNLFLQLSKN